MRKSEFHARIWSALLSRNKRLGLIRKGDRVLAAVSGGPDSVCLADFLASLRKRLDFELRLMHVHHGLRGPAADKDERFVRKLAGRLGVDYSVRRVDTRAAAAGARRGIEDAARRLRYRALAGEARRLSYNKVAVGHHLDDQAETFLLALLRGTRIEGLAGMPERRPLAKGIELVRPLLAVTRAQVSDYLAYRRLDFRKDSTNDSPGFTRNWLRLKVIPLLETRSPRFKEHLAGICESLRKRLRL